MEAVHLPDCPPPPRRLLNRSWTSSPPDMGVPARVGTHTHSSSSLATLSLPSGYCRALPGSSTLTPADAASRLLDSAKAIPFYRPFHLLIPTTPQPGKGETELKEGLRPTAPTRELLLGGGERGGDATPGREVSESSTTLLSTSLICTIFALGNPRQKGHSVMHPIDRDLSSPQPGPANPISPCPQHIWSLPGALQESPSLCGCPQESHQPTGPQRT